MPSPFRFEFLVILSLSGGKRAAINTYNSKTLFLGLSMKRFAIILAALINSCLADGSHVSEHSTTTEPPPKPYNFRYKAGRYNGHVDRIHQEARNEAGIIHGTYSYIDPKHKIRTVEYTADKNGFHPSLINFEDVLVEPADSEAVRLAKEKHLQTYRRIAEANARNVPAKLPQDSVIVARAKDKHDELYRRIAQQHAAIAAQMERSAYETTSAVRE